MYLFVFVCGGKHYTTAHVWRSEENFQELVLSFYRVNPGDQTQVLKLGSKNPYPLNHLGDPHLCSFPGYLTQNIQSRLLKTLSSPL